MERRVNTTNLFLELSERGIRTIFTEEADGGVVVELKRLGDNRFIGVARGDTFEGALATIIFRLAGDSKLLKETLTPFDGLSRL